MSGRIAASHARQRQSTALSSGHLLSFHAPRETCPRRQARPAEGATTMMKWIRSVVVPAAATAALIGPGLGCDEPPAVPQAVLDEASKPAESSLNKRPTTQSLLSGKR